MFIHEIPNWTNFSWDKDEVEAIQGAALLKLGFLAGRFSDIGFDNRLSATVETLTNNVVASFEIEGMKLNSDGIRSSIAKKFGVALPEPIPFNHYIEGIVDMMLDATEDYHSPLSEEKILNWHCKLFPYDTSIRVGKWRNDEMSVVSGTFGRERIHYRAPSAATVAKEMADFIAWYNSTPASLVKAAVSHFRFVCIHPFDDGNGRIARAIADRVMATVTGEKRPFYSLNRRILKKKDSYYKVLERVSRGNGDITEWLIWFFQRINEAVDEAGSMLSQVLNKATFWRVHGEKVLTERQKKVLNRYLDGMDAKLTAKNWEKIAGVSKDTALRDLASLVDKGIIRPTPGRVRDVAYSIIINEEVSEMPFTDIRISEEGKDTFISAVLMTQVLRDKLLISDVRRLSDGEISLQDLAYKYFAYALPEKN